MSKRTVIVSGGTLEKDFVLPIIKSEDTEFVIGVDRGIKFLYDHEIKPGTPVEELIPYLEQADMFLIMSVEPGFGGQAFIPESLGRIGQLRGLLEERGLEKDLEVDGGIYHSNVAEVLDAGANVIVSGSGVYRGDIRKNVADFMEILSFWSYWAIGVIHS